MERLVLEEANQSARRADSGQPERYRRFSRLLLAVVLIASVAPRALGDIEMTEAHRLFARGLAPGFASSGGLPPALFGRGSSVSVVVERAISGASVPPFAVEIGSDFFVLDVPMAEAESVALSYPGLRFSATPPRRLLLDRAAGSTHVSEFLSLGGGSGRGVVIGFVDSGVDVSHPDLRNPDGSTRVKWLVDFTRTAAGRQPEIEAELGCDAVDVTQRCAVYAGRDIDELIANGVVGDEPRDNVGHGTHIASLAAGNGRSGSPPRFVGLAPEADLVIARVTSGDSISDSRILRGVRFVFDRAEELSEPAVVNLSLGSDFGAHDGSSALERALSSFVGPDRPGRSIVVAAGNSAGLFAGPSRGFPGPLGIHTDVHVPRDSSARIPILTPATLGVTTRARVSVWLGFRLEDSLTVSFDRGGNAIGHRVPPGSAAEFVDRSLEIVILNGVGKTGDEALSQNAAVVIFDGEWPTGETFGITLEGRGTASVWVEGAGALDPSSGTGPLLPFATKEGTISVPASAPELIAVGATLNRTDWIDFQGDEVLMPENGALDEARVDGTAFFSSAGPNARGALKPEIVAPGMHVIGALSALADPRLTGERSMFSGSAQCPSRQECLLVDDFHAVSSGTSMASPLVAGAIALLFERDPGLVQHQVRALLQAGARRLNGDVVAEQQMGVGALDLEGSLTAQIAEDSPLGRVPGTRSFLSLAASYARPDPDWPLIGYVDLRDDEGKVADGFDARRLALTVTNARLVEPMARLAAGFYRFAVAAPAKSGGASLGLTLSFDGTPLIRRQVPIAVDRGALSGPLLVRGGSGCGVSRASEGGPLCVSLFSFLWCLLRRRRESESERPEGR